MLLEVSKLFDLLSLSRSSNYILKNDNKNKLHEQHIFVAFLFILDIIIIIIIIIIMCQVCCRHRRSWPSNSSMSSVLLMSSLLGDSFLLMKLVRLSVYFVRCLPLILVPQIFPLNIYLGGRRSLPGRARDSW